MPAGKDVGYYGDGTPPVTVAGKLMDAIGTARSLLASGLPVSADAALEQAEKLKPHVCFVELETRVLKATKEGEMMNENKPWRFFVCVPCRTPMTKPIPTSDEHACPSCKRAIDGWYPPQDVLEIAVARGVEVHYDDHVVVRDFKTGTHTVDGERGPRGLMELAGVRDALAGKET